MKSRHLPTMHSATYRLFWRGLPWAAALLLLVLGASAFAQDGTDPPGRAAYLSARQGSVVFAPQGEDEWTELPANRPLTRGDRLWADRGARAELQLGTATLHVDGHSHLGVSDLDERSAQFILQQGSVNARVRELLQGENFEIDTPHLALRALQPGDYRVDVDPRGETRVVVASGQAVVYGEGGQAVQLRSGQQGTYSGRNLAQVNAQRVGQDDFGAWAAGRNRAEDQALATRYVPRGVVGATQLDAHGTWSQDPALGTVWYPLGVPQDWAPYRYGHWSWVEPWGWTWIDDAPWGFAPFHYGRWTLLGQRWAWVPGPLEARPLYAPALVVFLGDGGSGLSFTTGGPGVGWYPLAPGEAWWPWYRTSPHYVTHANHRIDLHAYPRHRHDHVWRQRPHAITVVRDDDFRRGRPVHRHWSRVGAANLGDVRTGVAPQRPGRDRPREERSPAPRLRAAPAVAGSGVPDWRQRERPPAVREQYRAQREQDELQRDAERAARRQIREAEEQRRQDAPPRYGPDQREGVDTWRRPDDRMRSPGVPGQPELQPHIERQRAAPIARERSTGSMDRGSRRDDDGTRPRGLGARN